MQTIKLPNGYNNGFVECECEPIEKNGKVYKLRVKDSYLIRWCTREQWEAAMWKAYVEEIKSGINGEYVNYESEMYKEEERRQKYEEWLAEESNSGFLGFDE